MGSGSAQERRQSLIPAALRTALRPVHAARIVAHARRQRRLVLRELSAPAALEPFAARRALPDGYGVGANERVIEIPWLLAQGPSGRALDAGSSLNHAEFLDRLDPLLDELHIVTLAYEGVAYPQRGVSYAFSDLRALPYRDGYFETVISISTLEHVGMDNTAYAEGAATAADPAKETDEAVRELARVLRSGGRLLVTVPYGEREDHGRFRQFDHADVDRLLEVAQPREAETVVYRYSHRGWALSDLDEASNARYRSDFGAEAVACICMTR